MPQNTTGLVAERFDSAELAKYNCAQLACTNMLLFRGMDIFKSYVPLLIWGHNLTLDMIQYMV